MADIETLDISSQGLNRDVDAHLLPLEAFTLAENMRFKEQGVERILGKQQVMGTPNFAPIFAQVIRGTAQERFWVYLGKTKAALYYGGTHTDLTRVSGDYNANGPEDWNSTLLGGVPIFNNFGDVPQMWLPISSAQKLQDLTNWDATWRARIMRAFGPYLCAFNVTKGGSPYPNLVKWSHPADPGTVPTSWNSADPTVDAGEKDLSDTDAGDIIDARMLRGQMYIYKERSTWVQRLIGGRFIFSFDPFLETSGILGPRCVATTGDAKWHFVATQDDIIIHDGNNVVPIMNARMKKYLFKQIDPAAFRSSFVFNHPYYNEMWFCYPSVGATSPNRALVWNYGVKSEIGVFTECDVDFVHAGIGDVEANIDLAWDDESILTWDGADDFWDSVVRQQVVVSNYEASKLQQLDAQGVVDNDGTPIVGRLQRESLAYLGMRRDKSPIQDFTQDKMWTRIWIRATGGPFNVRVGYQTVVSGTIMWDDPIAFDPSTQLYIDPMVNGVALAVEFSGSVPFSILGYKAEVFPAGRFG